MDIAIDFFFEILWFMAWWGLMMFSIHQFIRYCLLIFVAIGGAFACLLGPK